VGFCPADISAGMTTFKKPAQVKKLGVNVASKSRFTGASYLNHPQEIKPFFKLGARQIYYCHDPRYELLI